MFFMYDDVTLDMIPAMPHAVAAYVNGRYANVTDARKRFPHARLLEISVEGNVPAQGYDVENGDYAPDHVRGLYELAKSKGIWRPCFYANLSTMPAVKEALRGIPREDYRLWVAYYDDVAILTAGYDAHQFTKTALNRSLDESICASNFFEPVKVTPVTHPVNVTRSATVTFDGQDWSVKAA